MQFKEWLLVEKYVSSRSAYCNHCGDRLFPVYIVENPKHIYKFGQLWKCHCDNCRLWTNSVRNAHAFIESANDPSSHYYQGFCNDKFCGFCFAKLPYPTKNGVEPSFPYPTRMDQWECPNGHNKDLLMDGYKEYGEGQEEEIKRWYKKRIDELIDLIHKK